MSDTSSSTEAPLHHTAVNLHEDKKEEPRKKDDDSITLSQGLTALKEIWSAGSRFARLQQEYAGKKIPIEKIFGALLGFGESQPNPLAVVEQRLAEINAKLDRVLEGIQEIQTGLLGLGVLSVYIDIGDSVFLIEKYSEALPSYIGTDPTVSEADRKDFVDKILGAKSERDSVAFCVQKIVKLGPNKTPLLFDLLFPYVATGAKAENAYEKYMKGAYAFRFMADTLIKGWILEVFAATTSGDPNKMSARVEKVVNRYQTLLKSMVYNSFLPFAETLATLRFVDEYLGGNTFAEDAHRLITVRKDPQVSILRSADDLANKILGRPRAFTLRVIPHVPPIAESVVGHKPTGAVSAGSYTYEYRSRTPLTALTRAGLLDIMEKSNPSFFVCRLPDRKGEIRPDAPMRVTIPYLPGAKIPTVFAGQGITFLRCQFDFSAQPEKASFTLGHGNLPAIKDSVCFSSTWERIWTEGGRKSEGTDVVNQCVIERLQSELDLPEGGQLSPVLITYMYEKFGHDQKHPYPM